MMPLFSSLYKSLSPFFWFARFPSDLRNHGPAFDRSDRLNLEMIKGSSGHEKQRCVYENTLRKYPLGDTCEE